MPDRPSAPVKARRALSLATDVGVESGVRPGEAPAAPTREYDGYTQMVTDGPVTVGEPLPKPDEPPMSETPDFASKHASKQATRFTPRQPVEPSVTLAALIGGPPDPETDLVTLSVRVPRYLFETVSLVARITRKPQQSIVANALRTTLPAERVEQVRDTLYP